MPLDVLKRGMTDETRAVRTHLRAASRIVNERDFLIVGSAAILGTFDDKDLPYEASRSDEADIAPYNDPDGEKSLMIEGLLVRDLCFTKPLVTTLMVSVLKLRLRQAAGKIVLSCMKRRGAAMGAVGV